MLPQTQTFVLVGCWDRYDTGTGNGYVVCRFDAATGALERVAAALSEVTVGATAVDRERKVIYCVDERADLPGNFRGGGGLVYAISFDPETGSLSEINRSPSFGSSPCHLTVDPAGEFLVVTHHTERTPVTHITKDENDHYRIKLVYDDATTVLFPINASGALGEPCDVFKHEGIGGPLARQTHPQLHSVTRSPLGNLYAICDKGNDKIQFFRINHAQRKLEACPTEAYRTVAGSSPRYSAFHPHQALMFVNHETKATVAALRYDMSGNAALVSIANALPEGHMDEPDNTKQSDLKLHPSGRFLYSLIRGTSSVSVFSVDDRTGALARQSTVQLDGLGPRGCAISPDGRFLLVACLSSSEVLAWQICKDGNLAPTGHKLPIANAGCIDFL